jgi:hypothetical protein
LTPFLGLFIKENGGILGGLICLLNTTGSAIADTAG